MHREHHPFNTRVNSEHEYLFTSLECNVMHNNAYSTVHTPARSTTFIYTTDNLWVSIHNYLLTNSGKHTNVINYFSLSFIQNHWDQGDMVVHILKAFPLIILHGGSQSSNGQSVALSGSGNTLSTVNRGTKRTRGNEHCNGDSGRDDMPPKKRGRPRFHPNEPSDLALCGCKLVGTHNLHAITFPIQ